MTLSKSDSRKEAREAYWKRHDRLSYECPDCGRIESQLRTEFQVHHRDGDPSNNDPSNQVGLCRPCHNLREGKKPSIRDICHLRNQANPGKDSSFDASTVHTCDICGSDLKTDSQCHKVPHYILCRYCHGIYSWLKRGEQASIPDHDLTHLRKASITHEANRKWIYGLDDLSRDDRIVVVDSNMVPQMGYWVHSITDDGFSYANPKKAADEVSEKGVPTLCVQKLHDRPKPGMTETFQTYLDREQVVKVKEVPFHETIGEYRIHYGIDRP